MPQILWQRTALRPWTTWHAPLIGQWFMKRHKVLSHHGPSVTTKRGMTTEEARAYHRRDCFAALAMTADVIARSGATQQSVFQYSA
jgi:hypothetical protein